MHRELGLRVTHVTLDCDWGDRTLAFVGGGSYLGGVEPLALQAAGRRPAELIAIPVDISFTCF